MPLLDSTALARRLQARHGLALSGFVADVSGGQFAAVRPLDLDTAHGFAVQIARSPRYVTAVFDPDLFSGRLLRQMSEADLGAKRIFEELFAAAEDRGLDIALEINGQSLPIPLQWPDTTWQRLELECSQRIPPGLSSEAGIEDLAVDTTSYLFALLLALLPVEEVDMVPAPASLAEGTPVSVVSIRYERSLANRTACITYHGLRCAACGFDYRSAYGDLGEDYIEVHHRTPLSLMGGSATVDPIRDLIPLCANCHAMVHRCTPPVPVDELRALLADRAASNSPCSFSNSIDSSRILRTSSPPLASTP